MFKQLALVASFAVYLVSLSGCGPSAAQKAEATRLAREKGQAAARVPVSSMQAIRDQVAADAEKTYEIVAADSKEQQLRNEVACLPGRAPDGFHMDGRPWCLSELFKEKEGPRIALSVCVNLGLVAEAYLLLANAEMRPRPNV
jgi:hypothetical protein